MKFYDLVLSALWASVLFAQSAPKEEGARQPQQVDKSQIVPSLFELTAKGCDYVDGVLTLREVGATSIIFADRPKRMAGHIQTKELIDGWSEGPDSFEKIPPNADLSIFTSPTPTNAVVTLLHPRLEGDNLLFDVKVLNGDLPAKGNECSLFIDIIGRPWTPMSYAGVARRSYARGVYYSAPHVAVY
jgi:hypothetical protein